ncbi:type II secretion system F family protein [Aquirhabdus sp.]|uniref:type II secretion system F family protein n=1 Tax=Aquirhabdus sp. TaxID=2824160 RepID=UPI00396C38C2
MANFKVRGLTHQGALQEQVLVAATIEEARQFATRSGIEVLDIKSVGIPRTFLVSKPHFNLALFAYELVALLRAGLSLIETLETLTERQQNVQQNHFILSELVRHMREGKSFSSALKSFPAVFPILFIASIAASESTGDMVDALQRYLRYHEQMNVIRQKIISASIYPALLLCVGFAVGLFLLCFLVPRFSHVYQGLDTKLPLASRLLMEWGLFASEHVALITTVVVASMFGLFMALRQPVTKRFFILVLQENRWVGSQFRLLQLSRFYRSLGLLLSGGIPIVKALQMTQGLLSINLQFGIAQAIQEVQQGKGLADSLHRVNMTTPVALRLLGAGERNGQMADMLEQIAAFHDKEVTAWVDRFTRLFEPLLMLFIGLVIGGIVIMLYLPIFELAGSVG